MQVIFVTTDDFLGKEGEAREDRLVENAVGMVRDGKSHLAIQLRVKDAGEPPLFRRGGDACLGRGAPNYVTPLEVHYYTIPFWGQTTWSLSQILDQVRVSVQVQK